MKKYILLFVVFTYLKPESSFEKLQHKVHKSEKTNKTKKMKLRPLDKKSISIAPERAKEILQEWQNKETSVYAPRGVLLSGKTGTGKTTLAEAMAKSLGREYILINSEMIKENNGCTAQFFKENFLKILKENKPFTIIFDEIDTLVDNPSDPTAYIALMWLLDKIQDRPHINLIATSNHPENLPDPVKGRFGNNGSIVVNTPNKQGRKELLQFRLTSFSHNLEEEFIEKFIEKLDGLTIREINDLIKKAKSRALKRDIKLLTMQDLDDAYNEIPKESSVAKIWNTVRKPVVWGAKIAVATTVGILAKKYFEE